MHYSCIAWAIDSVMGMEKKNYPQGYLEECKHRMNKTEVPKFIEAELESASKSDLESHNELELKFKVEPDSE